MSRSGFVKIPPLIENPDSIPLHTQSTPIPICTKPITKQEYLEYITQLRGEQEFDRLPFASWAYEEFPEFAETPEQIAAINAQWTEETLRAKEKNDLEAEKKALETKISRLKQMARKNRAIKTARRRLEDIAIRQEEMRLQDSSENIKINTA
jgi:hypothetical protein